MKNGGKISRKWRTRALTNAQEKEIEQKMLAKIDDVLAGKVDFLRFAREFTVLVIDEFPSGALSDRAPFFDDAQDRLEDVRWTSTNIDEEPSDDARAAGMVTQREYLAWLRERREQYRVNFGH